MKKILLILIIFFLSVLYADTFQIKEIYGEIERPDELIVLGKDDSGYGLYDDYYLFEDDSILSYTSITSNTSKPIILLIPTDIDLGTYKVSLEEISTKEPTNISKSTNFYKIDGTDLYLRLDDYESIPLYHGDILLVIKSPYTRYLYVEDAFKIR